MGKVYTSWKELTADLDRDRRGRKIVFTNGCFDILHLGHVRYLQEARRLGDFLVVGLNSDSSVQVLKGPTRPIQSEMARAEILAALACVDAVTIFGEQTAANLIREVRPDIYVKGGDYTPETIIEAPIVREAGGEVKVLKFTEGFSTSKIVEKMRL